MVMGCPVMVMVMGPAIEKIVQLFAMAMLLVGTTLAHDVLLVNVQLFSCKQYRIFSNACQMKKATNSATPRVAVSAGLTRIISFERLSLCARS